MTLPNPETETYYRRTSANYGRESAWSESAGTLRLTSLSWVVIGVVALASILIFIGVR